MSLLRRTGSLAVVLGLLVAVASIGVMVTLFPAQPPAWADDGLVSKPVADEPVAPRAQMEYEVVAWNDLGMHCYNPGFQEVAVLPPWNTLYAQVFRVGDPPEIVTAGLTVEFFFEDNTYSVGKTDFWDTSPYRPMQNAQWLFGLAAPLPDDVGLAGVGLAGEMEARGDHFVAEGIPLTEYSDSAPTVRDPFQLATVVVRDALTGAELARVHPVAPVSTEMHCEYCHYDGGPGNRDSFTGSVYQNILLAHDDEHASDYPEGYGRLMDMRPVLCAWCHASAALGAPGEPGLPNFSNAMHEQHAGEVPDTQAGCYNCHPGPQTQCQRDVMYGQYGMTCPDCHGGMADVAQKNAPWLEEPRCDDAGCHPAHVQDHALYRLSREHGGTFCQGCHDSTHAIAPSIMPEDGIKFMELQGYDGALRKCTVCHATQPTGPGPHGLVGPTAPGWVKQITTGDGIYGPLDSPIPVLPSSSVQVVDRVQVSGPASPISYTLSAGWTDLMGLTSYEISAGTVGPSVSGLSWRLENGAVDTWYTLTRTYSIPSTGQVHQVTDEVAVNGRDDTSAMQVELRAFYRRYLPLAGVAHVTR